MINFRAWPLYPWGNSSRYPPPPGWVGYRDDPDMVPKEKRLHLSGTKPRSFSQQTGIMNDLSLLIMAIDRPNNLKRETSCNFGGGGENIDTEMKTQ